MADYFAKFTTRARQALTYAEQEARRREHSALDAEHMLLGLIRDRNCTAMRALRGLGLDPAEVKPEVERLLNLSSSGSGSIGLTNRFKRVVELAAAEQRRLNQPNLGTEHLLLGIIREGRGNTWGFHHSLDYARAEVRRLVAQRDTSDIERNRRRVVHRVHRLRGFSAADRSEHRFVQAVSAAITALRAIESEPLATDFTEGVVIPQLRLLESMVVWDEPRAIRPGPDELDVDLVLDVVHRAAEVYLKHGLTVAGLALRDVESAIRVARSFKSG